MTRKNLQKEILCLICGNGFMVKQCDLSRRKCCSHACRSKYITGHKPFNWKGGRLRHKGYIYILVKNHPNADRDGYVTEHRFVIEQDIKRYLTSEEVVHHKNGKRDDNRIENLELIASQSDHMKLHGFGKHIRRDSKRVYR